MHATAGDVRYADLVHRLWNLEQLAVLPEVGERTAQWSSTDRRSQYDPATDSYVHWDSNGDAYGNIREEADGSLVMAEMEGPGCIWRIWTASAKDGHVKIYVDGGETPVVDLPFRAYFDGQHEPFTYDALVYDASRGKNCYVPIPYQRSCKVVAEKGWGEYYHIGYSTFAPGTTVPTFTRQLDAESLAALDEANAILNEPSLLVKKYSDTETITLEFDVPAGSAYTFPEIAGPAAITGIRAEFAEVPDDAALRGLALSIAWDDDSEPSVWCPLGDFFGTGPGLNPFQSLPCGVRDGACYANWYMPFAKAARLQITNDGSVSQNLAVTLTTAPLTRPLEALGRFHAKWHGDAFLPDALGRAIDWTILKTSGRGRFCGFMLHVWNPRGRWWGEGDEKFFVDGERYPSTFGTGSEDYFGYAWGDPARFSRPYHAQTRTSGNMGHVSVARWHISDNVPFQRSFEGSIEKTYPNDRPTRYDAVAYWYLDSNGSDPYQPQSYAARTNWPIPERTQDPPGRIEAEWAEVHVTGGRAEPHTLGGYFHTWPGDDAQLHWSGGERGDTLLLTVPIENAGSYAIVLQMVKGRNYARVAVEFDGVAIGEPVDLFDPQIQPAELLNLGLHNLGAGDHALTVRLLGADPEAGPDHVVGIDYVGVVAVTE